MYLLAFMPKNLVVTNWPFCAYHCGSASFAGSSVNAPRGCLSMPMAIPMSYLPNRIVSAQTWVAVAAVAHALNTSVNGIPVRPTSRKTASGFDTSWLPPTPNWISFQAIPASSRAAWMASAPICIAVLSNRPNGCRPTPMIATSFMRPTPSSRSDRREGERHDLVAFLVGGKRHHRQLEIHAEPQLFGIVLGEPALDPDHVAELNQPHTERHE